MKDMGFKPSTADASLFIKSDKAGNIYILVHVDDMNIAARTMNDIAMVKQLLMAAFEARDLGETRFFLGMEIRRDRKRRLLFLGQEKYARDARAACRAAGIR